MDIKIPDSILPVLITAALGGGVAGWQGIQAEESKGVAEATTVANVSLTQHFITQLAAKDEEMADKRAKYNLCLLEIHEHESRAVLCENRCPEDSGEEIP